MDECDGVGAGDRGGLQALMQVIKTSKCPIICVCNDRQHEKVQTIANHSYDIKFHRPNKNDIVRRIKQVCQLEGFTCDEKQLYQLIESSGNDIRQIINILQMWHTHLAENPRLQFNGVLKDEKVMINNFEAASRLLNQGNPQMRAKYSTFRDKQDLFFIDYDFVPNLVQENYLNSMGDQRSSPDDLWSMAQAADFISQGDVLNSKIRKEQNWALLPDYGTMSSVAPCMVLQGQQSYPAFPQALGKMSTMRKSKRLIREIKSALVSMNGSLSMDKFAIQTELVPMMLEQILKFLQKGQIEDLIEYLDEMHISNEMIKEHLFCLSLSPKTVQAIEKGVDTKTKTAFTKAYNKAHAKGPMKKGGAKGKAEESDGEDSSDNEDELIDA